MTENVLSTTSESDAPSELADLQDQRCKVARLRSHLSRVSFRLEQFAPGVATPKFEALLKARWADFPPPPPLTITPPMRRRWDRHPPVLQSPNAGKNLKRAYEWLNRRHGVVVLGGKTWVLNLPDPAD